jgi:hypothetical protein
MITEHLVEKPQYLKVLVVYIDILGTKNNDFNQ